MAGGRGKRGPAEGAGSAFCSVLPLQMYVFMLMSGPTDGSSPKATTRWCCYTEKRPSGLPLARQKLVY